MPVAEHALVSSAAALAARLGVTVEEARLAPLRAVMTLEDGVAAEGALTARASTTRSLNRDGEEVVYTRRWVELTVHGSAWTLDTLGVGGNAQVHPAILEVARAWDVERVVPLLRWITHPTLPEDWNRPPDLTQAGVQWSTSIVRTSFAVANGTLVGLSSANRHPPVAAVLGPWPGRVPSAAEPLPRLHPGAVLPSLEAAAAAMGCAAVEELNVTCPPEPVPEAGLWHQHLFASGALPTRLRRMRAGNMVLREVARLDGGGAAWLLQPSGQTGWALHAAFGRNAGGVDVHAVATDAAGLQLLGRVVGS